MSLQRFDPDWIKGEEGKVHVEIDIYHVEWLVCSRCNKGHPLLSFKDRNEMFEWMKLHNKVCEKKVTA